MTYTVLVKRETIGNVPCQIRHKYSTDNGETWISSAEYWKWKQEKMNQIFNEVLKHV